jgi:hypothetical protein
MIGTAIAILGFWAIGYPIAFGIDDENPNVFTGLFR